MIPCRHGNMSERPLTAGLLLTQSTYGYSLSQPMARASQKCEGPSQSYDVSLAIRSITPHFIGMLESQGAFRARRGDGTKFAHLGRRYETLVPPFGDRGSFRNCRIAHSLRRVRRLKPETQTGHSHES